MTRHARNQTNGSVYSYHERKKDSKQSGWGSKQARLGRDSIKSFDCCSLTLQPCKDPVITPDGYMFDKEAILEYILHQKRDIARKLKEYERQRKREENEMKELAKAEYEDKVKNFVQSEGNLTTKTLNPFISDNSKSSKSTVQTAEHNKNLPSFWIPSLTPHSKKNLIKKPDTVVRCPMSTKPLKFKELIHVKFKPITDDSGKSIISRDARYVCAVSNDALTDAVPCAVIRPSGVVVTIDTVNKLIRPEMRDPITSETITEKDIIPIQRGLGEIRVAKVAGPSIPMA